MKLIFIYGAVAAGKLTIARELAALTGLALFHNHLVVDAVAAVFPFGSQRFVRLREQWWLAMTHEAAEADCSLIFTYAPEESVAADFPHRVKRLVEAAGGELHFVRLIVSPEEQERRIGNADRGAFLKLRSIEVLRRQRPQFDAFEAAMPAPVLTIDTTAVPPAAAALKIAETFNLMPALGGPSA